MKLVKSSATLLCTVVTVLVAGKQVVNGASVVETFESFATNTILTTQIPGLTVSTPEGIPEIQTATNPVVPGEPQGLANTPYFNAPNYLVIDFTPNVSQAGAIIDFGTIGSGVSITAYDGIGATGNILGTQSTLVETFIEVVASGIQSIRFENLGGSSYLIDNLTYSFVPEPTTCGLAMIATLCLVVRRRRQ